MHDVFYFNRKPNLFPFEKEAASLDEATKLSTTEFFWYIDGTNDYANFDFHFKPKPWEETFTHVWGSQWQTDAGVYLKKKSSVNDGLHWMKDKIVTAQADAHEIWYVDHFNEGSSDQYELLKTIYPNIKYIRYVTSYIDTLSKITFRTEDNFVWVINSICDYSSFDFSWHPSRWLKDYLHVFPSNKQEFGDTFYMHVGKFRELCHGLANLSNMPHVHFCNDQKVPRKIDVLTYHAETPLEKLDRYEFKTSHVMVCPEAMKDNLPEYTPSNWSAPKLSILSPKGGLFVAPRQIKQFEMEQMYDFPRLDLSTTLLLEKDLDVIFLSNGESTADQFYLHLKQGCPRAKRIDGINGRTEALKAAAEESTTEWFFLVPAKLYVHTDFKWDWQPAYLEHPKHYIFSALNPVNGLCYGHMATVAYHKRLVLDTNHFELDFTQAAPHFLAPFISGTAYFNHDPQMAWRTAFREVLKLLYYQSKNSRDEETKGRLDRWCEVFEGINANWVERGVSDACDYFIESGGNLQKLQLSYSWKWLDEKYKYFS